MNDFIDSLAAEHSCISSKIRTVLCGTKNTLGLFEKIFITKSYTLRLIAKYFFKLGSFLKSIKITLS